MTHFAKFEDFTTKNLIKIKIEKWAKLIKSVNFGINLKNVERMYRFFVLIFLNHDF